MSKGQESAKKFIARFVTQKQVSEELANVALGVYIGENSEAEFDEVCALASENGFQVPTLKSCHKRIAKNAKAARIADELQRQG